MKKTFFALTVAAALAMAAAAANTDYLLPRVKSQAEITETNRFNLIADDPTSPEVIETVSYSSPRAQEGSIKPVYTINEPSADNIGFQPSSIIVLQHEGDYVANIRVKNWEPGNPMTSNVPLPEGNYDFVLIGKYDVDNMLAGWVYLYETLNLTADNNSLTFNFDDAVNVVEITHVLPNGEPMPDARNGAYEGNSVMSLDFELPHFATSATIDNCSHVSLRFNDLYAYCRVVQVVQYVAPDRSLYSSIYGVKSPIVESDIKTLSADSYRNISTQFCLTEREMASEGKGALQGLVYSTFTGGAGLETGWISKIGEKMTSPAAMANFPASHLEGEALYESGLQLMTVTNVDPEANIITYKATGYFMELDGRMVIVPHHAVQVDNGDINELSYIDFYPEIMIIDAENAMPMFYQAPNMSVDLSIWDNNGKIGGYGLLVNLKGPQNEFIYNFDTDACVKGVKINSTPTTLKDLKGTKVNAGDRFDFSLAYDDLTVWRFKTTSVEEEVSYVYLPAENEDPMPQVKMYQVRTANDKVTNAISGAEGDRLYIGAIDYLMEEWNMVYNPDFEVVVKYAEQDTDSWTELSGAKVSEWPYSIGALMEYPLSGIELRAGKWYKVNITVTDSNGSYVSETINNCFNSSTNRSGIESLLATPADESTIYYDLNGRIVSAPSAGLYIRGDRNPDGTLRFTKHVVR